MIALSRRSLLAGSIASLATRRVSARPADDADQRLKTLLDRAEEDRTALHAELAAFDAATLSLGARLDLRTARAGLAIDAELFRRFPFGRLGRSPYRVTPSSGAWLRADAPAEAIARETEALRADGARGICLPRGLIERTITAIERAPRPAQGARATALATQIAVLRAQVPMAPPPGLSALPQGRAYYTLLLRRTTGDDVDPERLRRRLESERERIKARASRLFAQIGNVQGNIGTRYSKLWRDPRWLYTDDDTGRARAVADMNRAVEIAAGQLPHWFGALPPQVRAVRAMRMPLEEEAAARQGYRILPDAGQPGRYVVDLREIRRRPSWTLPAVVHHELLPGHMVQLPLETLAQPHPLRLDYAQAFTEGWAIYAEGLAAAGGVYRGDPHAELGFCHWRLFRICRALADLGIHLGGWSVERVLNDWRDTMGEPVYFAAFAADLDRIILEPAIRAAEAASWLAIEDALRGRSAVSTHRALLVHGRMRTDLLRAPLTGT